MRLVWLAVKRTSTAYQASRNLSAIVQTSQALNEGVRKVSDEWFKFARARIECAFEHVDKAMRSRTPQELAVVQTEAVRDNLEGILQSTQHIAELSQQTANEASRKLSEMAERPKAGRSSVQPVLRAARKPPFVLSHSFAVDAENCFRSVMRTARSDAC